MSDLTTSTVRQLSLLATTPVYTAVTASDTFIALPNTDYELHYKNGATIGTGILKVVDPTSIQPAGATAVAGFADVPVVTNMAANSESIIVINSNRFRNSSGLITLTHAGTLTTITVSIKQLP